MSQAQAESTTRRQLIYGIQDDNGTDIQNFALDLTPPPDIIVRTREGTSDGMNVLGIVIFSATMGEQEGRAIVGVLVLQGDQVNRFIRFVIVEIFMIFPFS